MPRPRKHQRIPNNGDRSRTSAFLRVEKRGANGSRHFIVHAETPRLVVEFQGQNDGTDSSTPPVIRRVRVPNSPIGGYQFCGSMMESALASIESLQ